MRNATILRPIHEWKNCLKIPTNTVFIVVRSEREHNLYLASIHNYASIMSQ